MALKSALNAVDRIRNVQALELLALERLAAHHGIPGLTETMGPLRERGARPESIGTASDSIESFPPQQAHSPWRPRAGQCAELMRYHVNDAGRITALPARRRRDGVSVKAISGLKQDAAACATAGGWT